MIIQLIIIFDDIGSVQGTVWTSSRISVGSVMHVHLGAMPYNQVVTDPVSDGNTGTRFTYKGKGVWTLNTTSHPLSPKNGKGNVGGEKEASQKYCIKCYFCFNIEKIERITIRFVNYNCGFHFFNHSNCFFIISNNYMCEILINFIVINFRWKI